MNRLVVISNRVPDPAASAQAGGLAVALSSLMQRRGGLWFGWSGQIVDQPARAAVLGESQGCARATIDLSPEEHARYYTGFSNSVLWPALHGLPDLMNIDRVSTGVYRQVNERMASALVPLLTPADLIWVHDYHLLPMAACLRARGVRAPIGFFLHVPFPAMEIFARIPEARALLRDLFAADMVGFQTTADAENFAHAAEQLLGARRLGPDLLAYGARRLRLGSFPVEIDAANFATLATDSVQDEATVRLQRSLNGQTLIIGADRLDPTKGLVQRLASFRRLLETAPQWRERCVMLQIAAASRQDVATYRDLRGALERLAGSVNAEWGEPDWTPLRVIARAMPRTTMAGYMRLARVALVTPLRDGMNLVAKEFVAAQDPTDPGVLVLSRFAGAAQQLTSALLVNPHDPEEIADALARALAMPLAERRQRWQEMWAALEGSSALEWGQSYLAALQRAARPVPMPIGIPGLTEIPAMTPDAANPITLLPILPGRTPIRLREQARLS